MPDALKKNILENEFHLSNEGVCILFSSQVIRQKYKLSFACTDLYLKVRRRLTFELYCIVLTQTGKKGNIKQTNELSQQLQCGMIIVFRSLCNLHRHSHQVIHFYIDVPKIPTQVLSAQHPQSSIILALFCIIISALAAPNWISGNKSVSEQDSKNIQFSSAR